MNMLGNYKLSGTIHLCLGEQGSRSGDSAHLPKMRPGFDSGLGSCVGCRFSPFLRRFFSGSPVFLPPQNPTL